MAKVFVFTDEEEARAKEMEVNYFRLKDTSDESLEAVWKDPFITIFMPFLLEKEQQDKIMMDFHNQIAMRKIWKGE